MKNNRLILLQAFAVDNKGLFAMGKKINIKGVAAFNCKKVDRAREIMAHRPEANLAVWKDSEGDVWDVVTGEHLHSRSTFNFNGVRL